MDPEAKSKYAIHEACREGRTAEVEALLNANPRLATRRDEDDRLPLHWAVSYNRLPIVRLLVLSKEFDVDAQDGLGWTPLMMAASLRDGEEVLELLLSRGAEVNIQTHTGQTALHFASSKALLQTARTLLAHGASTRLKDKRAQLPLHRAAAVGAVPVLKLLLANRSPLDAGDVDGLTGLHHAISEGHADAAVFLLKEGAVADIVDREGRRALELAPDAKVRDFILRSAEREGIDLG